MSVFSSLAMAQAPLCVEHFRQRKVFLSPNSGIKSPQKIYQFSLATDNRFSGKNVTDEAMIELFQMMGHTEFNNVQEKQVFEKGEVTFGVKIDDDVTIEGEYAIDKSQTEPYLYLKKINMTGTGNGKLVLTRSALHYSRTKLMRNEFSVVFQDDSSDGRIISNSDISLTEKQGFDSNQLFPGQFKQATVALPPTIKGEAYEKLIKWSHVIPYIKHQNLVKADTELKKNIMMMRGQLNRLWKFNRERFFQELYKIVFIVGATTAVNQYYNIKKVEVNVDLKPTAIVNAINKGESEKNKDSAAAESIEKN